MIIKRKTYPILPSAGYAQLRIFNGVHGCDYNFSTNLKENATFTVNALNAYEDKFIPIKNGNFTFLYQLHNEKEECPQFSSIERAHEFKDATAYSLFIQPQHNSEPLYWFEDKVDKSARGAALVRTLANVNQFHDIVWKEAKSGTISSKLKADNKKQLELRATEYMVMVDEIMVHQQALDQGGVYALIIGNANIVITKMVTITEPNSISILWLIPQYIVLTLGEVMFSVTGLEFSYSQAPMAMKTVLQACWLLTVAFGNVIVVIIAEAKIFNSQANEFFLFAGLMFADMMIFMWMAYDYKPNNPVIVENDLLTKNKINSTSSDYNKRSIVYPKYSQNNIEY
ncbi:peptide transporter family 1-like [Teleopsis dalmanni]|uniref:peptide transporter family 1-like n=1 Tax=Teleopsis dalmanni TaxID=139649 RepID=UPI0018CF6E62|nr:peptide transporter family 1-like [Teleopsis dalmanni]